MRKKTRRSSRKLIQAGAISLVFGISLVWYASHQQALKADTVASVEQSVTIFGGVLATGFLIIAISAFLFILAISTNDK
ncbi:MAG TPA: hypothetical protein PK263_04860 [bacterium]|nr:hypothetical protein [bacterium]